MTSEQIQNALRQDQTIDITTVGRRSGAPHRIEIWFHNLQGRLYISGLPGQRGWYANLLVEPRFTFHLKQSAQADLPALAHPVTDPAERERVLRRLLAGVSREGELDDWLQRSPLIEVELLNR